MYWVRNIRRASGNLLGVLLLHRHGPFELLHLLLLVLVQPPKLLPVRLVPHLIQITHTYMTSMGVLI